MKETLLKTCKIYFSIRKEQQWLEEMARKGWKLKNLDLGIWYTFEPIKPTHLVYEMDRFHLPKHPTQKDIKHKDEFLSMAEEMGWEVVVHDEDMNYYFCKEYVEGDINELHNDLETKQMRAETYRSRFRKIGKDMNILSIIMALLGVLWTVLVSNESKEVSMLVFLFTYIIIVLGVSIASENLGEFYYRELMLSEEQWKHQNVIESENKRIIRKLIFRNHTLTKFLREQSAQGWHVSNMSSVKYTFTKDAPTEYDYAIDSMYLVNQRNKELGNPTIKDKKDWAGLNNDWQIQSMREAQKRRWDFVCAMDNRAILYRSKESDNAQPLHLKSHNFVRFTTIVGKFTLLLLASGMAGAICGFVAFYLQKYL